MRSTGLNRPAFAAPAASPLSSADSAAAGTIPPSILVVEDEEDIRELISYNLLKEGFQVASVALGEEALVSAAPVRRI